MSSRRPRRKVARALLARYPAAGLQSTAALADAAGTSKPTVLRLLARLGFGGYPVFQERLRAEATRSMSASPLSRAGGRGRRRRLTTASFSAGVKQRARLVTRLQDTVPPGEDRAGRRAASRTPEARHCLRRILLAAGRPHAGDAAGSADPQCGLRRRATRRGRREVPARRAGQGRDRAGRAAAELAAREIVAMAKTGGASVILITDQSLSPSAEQADIVLPVGCRRHPLRFFRRAARAHREPCRCRLPQCRRGGRRADG